MKLKQIALLGISMTLVHVAKASDLESILDEGSQSKATKAAPASGKTTPLAQSVKKALGNVNSEQNIFLRYVENAEWEKAVLQFPGAFEGTAFQKSANGRALLGYMQFQAGLPVTGVQTLFMAANPKEINSTLREEWKKIAPVDHFSWDLAQVEWQDFWEVVFGDAMELRVKTVEALATTKNLDQLKKLSAQAPANSKEKALIDWQLVIAYSLNDQADQAAKLLANLMKMPYAPVSKDLMQITAGRLLFQNGYFDSSIKYLAKIAKYIFE